MELKIEGAMKITPQILSIPPYLSTSWNKIASLFVKEESGHLNLTILLQSGHQVVIPHLSQAVIKAIFDAHAKYTGLSIGLLPQEKDEASINLALPMNQADGNTIDVFGSAAQHNPEHANFPSLPPQVLKKIAAIAQALGMNTLPNFSHAESGCNCVFCQVVRAIQGETQELSQEEVTAEDLKFRTWDIEETAEKLFIVKNPLDPNEHYNVFLGEPIGCTCGQKNCEHIRAVLNT